MTREEEERIKELKRIIYMRTNIIRQCKKDIVNAKKEIKSIGNDKSYERKRVKEDGNSRWI